MYKSVSDFITKTSWWTTKQGQRVVLTSAPCDPIHPSHISYLRAAYKLGDILIILVNTDKYLKHKKGYCLMPAEDRATILDFLFIKTNVFVVLCDDLDIADAILEIQPDVMANGGDRIEETANSEELAACRDVGCMTIYGVGGYNKTRSSSGYFLQAVNDYQDFIHKECKV